MKALAADIGGTKTLLRLVEYSGDEPTVVDEKRYASGNFPHPLPMFEDFLESQGQVDAACFGVAGPVSDEQGEQTARVTNLPWNLNTAVLKDELNIPKMRLINDFQAIGYAIEELGEKDLTTLQTGTPVTHGARAVIGAGTGLGEGGLTWSGDHYEVLGSEGGHVDFAPTDDTQLELLRFLRGRYERVSYERVLSGPGLSNIYSFVRERNPKAENPDLAQAMRDGDAPAAITEFALWREDKLARQAVDIFVKIYGAQAGNIALTWLAHGGVYIAGGIAPKIVDFLDSDLFLEAFLGKGRMRELLESIPVRVVLNPKVGLVGAAAAASRL